MEKVLVLDPGENVGWCHAEIEPEDVEFMAPGAEPGLKVHSEAKLEVTGHGITPLKDFAVKLAEVAGSYDAIVYEVYRIQPGKERQHTGSEVPTLQFIGMVRLLGWLSNVSLVRQSTTQRDTGFKVAANHLPQVQEIIDRLPKKHDDAHDGDALAHLAFYYFQNYL